MGASGGAQGHRTVRGTLTVKGQGGASCGLGLDDVAVRDLRASRGILVLRSAMLTEKDTRGVGGAGTQQPSRGEAKCELA